MSTVFSEQMAEVATRLIAFYGTTWTLTRPRTKVSPEASKPWRDQLELDGEPESILAVLLPLDVKAATSFELSQDTLRLGLSQMLISGESLSGSLLPGDTVTKSGETWRVTNVAEYKPQGVTILYWAILGQ